MTRRTKLKRARLTVVARNEIHDRRAVDLTHKDVAPIEIDDPYEEQGKIIAMRSLRDDPLAAMHSKNHINNCQYLAGRQWQKAYELAEIGGAQAIDYTRDKVDGGQIAQPTVSDVQARSISMLTNARKALGDYGASIVFDVLARHMTLQQIADQRMMTRDVEVRFLGRRFHECLDTLAKVFGLSTK